MRYFLHIAYRGSNYQGWQRQPNAVSIQQTIEEALLKMTGEKVAVNGCGRTDAGVHAERYFLHTDLVSEFNYDPVERINRILPNDIAVFDFLEMPDRAHAQYEALERTYTYRMHGRVNPFLEHLSSYYPLSGLNFAKMQAAVAMLVHYEDYKAFCKRPEAYPHTICAIKSAELIYKPEKEQAIFTIRSNRFLRGMIRLLVGNLILIGQNRMSLNTFEDHLKSGKSPKFYTAAYPQGLYLSDVKYPYSEINDLSHKSVFL